MSAEANHIEAIADRRAVLHETRRFSAFNQFKLFWKLPPKPMPAPWSGVDHNAPVLSRRRRQPGLPGLRIILIGHFLLTQNAG
jgi:hypothetical protein